MKYVKKPIVIEAIEYKKEMSIAECMNFCDKLVYDIIDNEYAIKTLEGMMRVSEGDFIIKGVQGEFYPCKPDIFKATYDEVEEN